MARAREFLYEMLGFHDEVLHTAHVLCQREDSRGEQTTTASKVNHLKQLQSLRTVFNISETKKALLDLTDRNGTMCVFQESAFHLTSQNVHNPRYVLLRLSCLKKLLSSVLTQNTCWVAMKMLCLEYMRAKKSQAFIEIALHISIILYLQS